MNILATHLVDAVTDDEQIDLAKENQEVATTKEVPRVGHAVNMFNCILIDQKSMA